MSATADYASKRIIPDCLSVEGEFDHNALPFRLVAAIGALVMRVLSSGGALRWAIRIGEMLAILAVTGLLASCMRSTTGGTGVDGGSNTSTNNGYTFSSGGADGNNGSDGANGEPGVVTLILIPVLMG